MQEKKILVTGFVPFGGDAKNPSFEAVRLLPEVIGNARICRAELPVEFDRAGDRVTSLIDELRPDAVLCTGLAGGRKAVTPEVIAVNLRNARIPDNAGFQPVFEKILPDGPDGIFSALPVRAMTEALQADGIPAELSYSAGTYVCNEVMYRVLAHKQAHFPKMPAGFVHVPYAAEFPHGEAFSLPIEEIAKGLATCLTVIAGSI